MHVLALPAGLSISAAGGGNGILILIALLLFAVAAFLAVIIAPRNWQAVLVAAGLAIFMAALLVGS